MTDVKSTNSVTAGDVKDALHRRYNRPSQGREGEQWICLEEARSGAGFTGNNGQCDFLAINTWRSRGMELIGHEVKVSMSDWKAELAKPEKAEVFARYCRRWYVAVPSDLAVKIKDEVPPAWGLLSMSGKGTLREVRSAPARAEVEPVPDWWWVGWLAQIDRQHKRRLPRLVEQGMADERKTIEDRMEARVAERRRHQDEADAVLRQNAETLRAETGINLRYADSYALQRLGHIWNIAQRGVHIDHLAANLRRTADALDEALAQPEQVSS